MKTGRDRGLNVVQFLLGHLGLVGVTVDVEDVPLLGRIEIRGTEPMIVGDRWEIFGDGQSAQVQHVHINAEVCICMCQRYCCELMNVRGWVGLPCCALWVDECVGICEYVRST